MQIQETVLHEVLHAVDTKVTCNEVDDNVDQKFAGNTIYLNYTGTQKDMDQSLFTVTRERQFYDYHAAENVMEDRATTGVSLFYGRGRVQFGDKDHGSEFDRKQAELVARYDAMAPGLAAFIENRTVFLRDEPTNELNYRG